MCPNFACYVRFIDANVHHFTPVDRTPLVAKSKGNFLRRSIKANRFPVCIHVLLEVIFFRLTIAKIGDVTKTTNVKGFYLHSFVLASVIRNAIKSIDTFPLLRDSIVMYFSKTNDRFYKLFHVLFHKPMDCNRS